MSIPTVKDWIRRGTLVGQPVGGRWRVSEDSIQKVLDVRRAVVEMDAEGHPTEEEIYEPTKRVRRQILAAKAREE